MRELNDKDKTTLDENAAIYGKRDERGAFEKLKEMKGAEKWQFFRDYFLWKLIAVIAGVVALVLLLVKIFGPQEVILYDIAVLDNPFTDASYDSYSAGLTEALVSEEHQRVIVDTAYYVSADEFNTRQRLMTYIAASEIDCMILPEKEFLSYLNSDLFADIEPLLSASALSEYKDKLVYKPTVYDERETPPPEGSVTCYAINISDMLTELNGFDLGINYYMVSILNSRHPENFETAVSVLNSK